MSDNTYAVPDMEAASVWENKKKRQICTLVADIHFDYRLAVAAIEKANKGKDKSEI